MEFESLIQESELHKVADAFSEYIHLHRNLDLLWSEKLGYVLLSIDEKMGKPYSVDTYLDAKALVARLLDEIATDVVLDTDSDNAPGCFTSEEKEIIRKRWAPFLEKLPEYKDICEPVLAGEYSVVESQSC